MDALVAPPPPARLPRYRRVTPVRPLTIGRPERLILEALARFFYLTAEQVRDACGYSRGREKGKGSITFVEQALADMFHAKFVNRTYLPKATPGGSPRAIYVLDTLGLRHLRHLGETPAGRFWPSEQARRELLFLEHKLAANAFLILAIRLIRQYPSIMIAQLLTERQLKREPVHVEIAVQKGERRMTERVLVVPDGHVTFHAGGRYAVPLALELDRATASHEKIAKKIAGLLGYANGAYRERHGGALTVVFVAPTEQRRRQLLQWTEATLEHLHARHEADLFRFAAFDPATAEPAAVFFAPIWRRPFDAELLSLFPYDGGG